MHLVPGRLRLRSESLKGDKESAGLVCRTLAGIRGVRDCRVNVVTGSITIHFDDGETTAHAILNFLIEQRWVANVIPFPGRPSGNQVPLAVPVIAGKAGDDAGAGAAVITTGKLLVTGAVSRYRSSPVIQKLVVSAVKVALPLIVERYLGKTAAKLVSSVI